jgi:RNA polymerase sigma factor (sigma-70 family)
VLDVGEANIGLNHQGRSAPNAAPSVGNNQVTTATGGQRLMPESDALLLQQAAAGHAAAFPALLRRHGQAIHAYLARRGGREAADDLLSEVFLRAYAARRQYDERWHDARPWLYGIARNVLREHWRRAGARRAGARRAGGELSDLAAIEDPWPDVDASLDAAAQLPRLRSALAQLGAGDRAVLLLVTWEGLTPAEAAVALRIPPGTARSRLHRARSVMRQLLDTDTDTNTYTGTDIARPAASRQEA